MCKLNIILILEYKWRTCPPPIDITIKDLESICYCSISTTISMIFGPMTKVVAENIDILYVPRCSLGYEFAALIASPATGMLAAFMVWHSVFVTSSVILIIMGLICILAFTLFEKKGMVQFSQYTPPVKKGGELKFLIKHRIIRFTFISIITGVVRTTVVFWLPTYISQNLAFLQICQLLFFRLSQLAFLQQHFYQYLFMKSSSAIWTLPF